MPNWCWNYLTISGSKEELKRFQEFAKEGKELIKTTKFVPYPKEKFELEKAWENNKKLQDRYSDKGDYWFNKGENKTNGYWWCVKNWGTKWGIYRASLDRDIHEDGTNNYTMEYSFDSAWSPPEGVVKKMGEMFPRLYFNLTYEESGMGFKGELTIENGAVTKDLCEDWDGRYEDDEDDEFGTEEDEEELDLREELTEVLV